MADEFVQQLIALENEWLSRKPEDGGLKDILEDCLSAKSVKYDTVVLGSCNIDYFIRSYRAAYESILGDMKVKKNATKKEVNTDIKSLIKHTVFFKIGDVTVSITTNPSGSHLGNGHIHGIGKYEDIWPMLNLITDGKKENNKALARLFLQFGEKIFAFKQNHLKEINPKFNSKELHSSIPYYCKYLTGLAFLYVYYEPSRRLRLHKTKNKFEVHGAEETIFAASMISILKLLRDGYISKLEDVFSPDSDYIIFTRQAVSQIIKKPSPEIQALVDLNFLRITKKHGKDTLNPSEQRHYYLNPNSEQAIDTEEYEGDDFTYS